MAELVRLPAELVRLLTDSRFQIYGLLFRMCFKPRRGEIISMGRSPLYGANDFYKP